MQPISYARHQFPLRMPPYAPYAPYAVVLQSFGGYETLSNNDRW
jgi:hypothetical protein